MIVGSGVDIVEVERIKKAVKKWNKNFIYKIFTKNELDYSHKKRYTYQHLAARFATKEAVLKAFGGGWLRSLPWKDVEVINDSWKWTKNKGLKSPLFFFLHILKIFINSNWE